MSAADFGRIERAVTGTIGFADCPPGDRIPALDAARGLAVFGILIRNIYLLAIPSSAFALPAVWGGENMINVGSWVFVEVFFDGSMRAIFSMLFGASALLIMGGCNDVLNGLAQVERYYRRLVVLMLIGLLHAYVFLWANDVLFLYGVFGLMLFPLRNLSPRVLLSIAAAAVFSLMAVQIEASFEDVELPLVAEQSSSEVTAQSEPAPEVPEQSDEAAGPNGQTEAADLQDALHDIWMQEVELRRGGYHANMKEAFGLAIEQHTTNLMENHLVDIGAMLLIGMALFKLGFLSCRSSTWTYLSVLICGYSLGIGLKIAPLVDWYSMLPEPYANWEWATILFDVSRLGIALGHLSTLMLLLRFGVFTLVTKLLASSGRMALTNYLTQTLVGSFVFYGFGLGMFGRFEHGEVLALAFTFGVLQILFSHLYLTHFRQGPFEALVRVLVNSSDRTIIRQRA